MEKMSRMQSFLVLAVQLFLLIDCSMQKRDVSGNIKVSESNSPSGLQLNTEDKYVVMDNGLLQVTLSNPGGMVTAITYNGIDNVLERHNKEDGRGYWDVVWHAPGYDGHFDVIEGTSFKVIRADNNQIEVSFTRSYNSSHGGSYIPLNIDKRFIMLPNSSGFYTYAIYEHLEGMPSFILGENRIAFKLRNDKFHYMALSDTRQRFMPESKDRENGQQLAYPEAVLLTDPSNSDLKGQVDDKYQFSCDNKDNTVHGWISFDPPTGFWMITPSDEFRIGGPLKQDLTSHVGPTTLNMFHSSHYSGIDLDMDVQDGEPWKKVYGPIFIYLNSVSKDEDPRTLWNDAKEQMLTEVKSWPYSFPASKDFPSLDKRGTVTGRLQIQDRYINQELIAADSAYVGLAAPGDVGSWQRESKGYQFWTRADSNGSFSINGVRAGEYNLYAWVPGFIGDYKYDVNITITPGSQVSLGDLVYAPPRDGPTLWEIGVPDRSAAEFFVPDPDPNYATKLYTNSGNVSTSVDKFRQYGLWFRYADLYPNEDLVYTVGASDYKKDWFFAHVTRNIGNNTFVSTTWQIRFKLDNVIPHTTYKVRLAIASATFSDVELRFNNPNVYRSHFTTHMIGKDNSIARHGIHGLYWLFSVDVRSDWLVTGNNTLYLTQSRHTGPFQGVMYDYIRLEGPSTSG